MKKIILVILTISSITLSGAMPEETPDELQTLTTIALTNDLPINGFEVIIKEDLPAANFKHLVNNPENSHFVSISKDENALNYQRTEELKTGSIKVEKRMLFTGKDNEKVELTVAIRGSTWNEEIEEKYKLLKKKLMTTTFKNNAVFFTCIQVTNGDIMGNRVVVNTFTESLGLVHKFEQNDTFEMSKLKKMIYGYTPLWNDKFVIEGIPYNLQIAGRKDENGDWNYTIGTPILVNEY